MPEPITTHVLTADDYNAVLRLWRASEGVEVAEGDDRESLVGYLQRNPGLSRVATCGSDLIGAMLCGHDGRRGLIYHLAVRPEYRGQGVGKRLVEECAAGLRGCGIKRVLILVAKDNLPGQEFWLARGFEQISGAAAFGLNLV
jgi:ribosomal protein S18 acetylase RimI-like enzyme